METLLSEPGVGDSAEHNRPHQDRQEQLSNATSAPTSVLLTQPRHDACQLELSIS